MRGASRASRRDRSRREVQADLDITAFLNLMVILVPFLLITAVFSRLAILELSVPSANAATAAEEDSLQLEVIVRADAIEIGGTGGGLLTVLPRDAETGHDYAGLTAYLQRVKAEDPDATSAHVLLEPDIEYDVLVQVMDAVRTRPGLESAGGALVQAELFPDIALGDAPARPREG